MSLVYDVDTAEFEVKVIERSHEVPVVVDFWAEWCGPCKVLGPTLEKVVNAAGGTVELAKVDVDSNQQLAGQFGVQGIPTVVAFKNGQPVGQFTGALPEPQVQQFFDQLAPSEVELQVTAAESLIDEGRDQEASAILSGILEQDPGNQDAGVLLAGMLLDAGENDAALGILGRLAPTEEVTALQAAARIGDAGEADVAALRVSLDADPDDHAAAIELARAEAASGDNAAALERLLRVVEARSDHLDSARQAMVDIFSMLGNDDDLTKTYRTKLATAIF